MAEPKPLWPGEAPGAPRPPEGTETEGKGGRLSHIEQPQYFLYPAPEGKRTGQAVVIFPGGGYTILAMNHEGHDYAKWLNERGISAMVVKYRVSGNDELGYRFPVPYLDARRAIRMMRSMAGELGVKEVGVMGSSAGGHLASVCATRFGDTFEEETGDAIDKLDCRPDFAILIYPVIAMEGVGHSGSRRRLLGEEPTPEMVEKLSTEKQVTAQTPPCFLLSTFDDGVDCRNSLRFAEACKVAKVPVTLHLFEKGGHGYGMNVSGKGELAVWPELLDAWLKR
ncbi:beta-xylanase [Haloferula helveola]|uniref:Beta-xylanase n=2 Tax=Haloferula helveola TaxID=490095 RepID=A0ABN6H0X4_9BACT|nr:beta-xylanase [Haloferula helveola]